MLHAHKTVLDPRFVTPLLQSPGSTAAVMQIFYEYMIGLHMVAARAWELCLLTHVLLLVVHAAVSSAALADVSMLYWLMCPCGTGCTATCYTRAYCKTNRLYVHTGGAVSPLPIRHRPQARFQGSWQIHSSKSLSSPSAHNVMSALCTVPCVLCAIRLKQYLFTALH